MSYQPNIDYSLQVSRGLVSGVENFSKFGANEAISTTMVPISIGGIYQTPTALTSLEILSSDADDTSAGTGARTVYIEGIGTNYAVVSETVSLNGVTAVALANQYYRIYRMYVATSGTYASASAGSQAGTITLRVSGAGATWASFEIHEGLGKGQSQIACYTVPAGKSLYIYNIDITVDSTKVVDIHLFQRTGIDTVSAPYAPMRILREYHGLAEPTIIALTLPIKINEKTDVGFMGVTSSGTADVSVQFDGYLVTN